MSIVKRLLLSTSYTKLKLFLVFYYMYVCKKKLLNDRVKVISGLLYRANTLRHLKTIYAKGLNLDTRSLNKLIKPSSLRYKPIQQKLNFRKKSKVRKHYNSLMGATIRGGLSRKKTHVEHSQLSNIRFFKLKFVKNLKRVRRNKRYKLNKTRIFNRGVVLLSGRLPFLKLPNHNTYTGLSSKVFNSVVKLHNRSQHLNHLKFISSYVINFLSFSSSVFNVGALIRSKYSNYWFNNFRRSPFTRSNALPSTASYSLFNKFNTFLPWFTKLVWYYPRVATVTTIPDLSYRDKVVFYKLNTLSLGCVWTVFKSFTLSLFKQIKSSSIKKLSSIYSYTNRFFFSARSGCSFLLGSYAFYLILSTNRMSVYHNRNFRILYKQVFSFVDARSFKKTILRRFTSYFNKFSPTASFKRMYNSTSFNFFSISNKLLKFSKTFNDHYDLNTNYSRSAFRTNFSRQSRRIRRIKFKPGYSRIWRKARTSLQTLMFLKFRYQHRLTRYLHRFYRIILWSDVHRSASAISLHTLLVRSRFTCDTSWGLELLSNDFVYLNGFLVNNPRVGLFKGDLLQLLVHIKFYIVYKWQKNLTIIKKARLKKFAKIKFKPKTTRMGADRNYTYPNWILTLKFLESDVPSYAEVDYFTLSLFIVYNPFLLNHYYNYDEDFVVPKVIRSYNWKYVT